MVLLPLTNDWSESKVMIVLCIRLEIIVLNNLIKRYKNKLHHRHHHMGR